MLDYTSALALAEGVTEVAQKRLLDHIANFQAPELAGTVSINNLDYAYEATPVGSETVKTDAEFGGKVTESLIEVIEMVKRDEPETWSEKLKPRLEKHLDSDVKAEIDKIRS